MSLPTLVMVGISLVFLFISSVFEVSCWIMIYRIDHDYSPSFEEDLSSDEFVKFRRLIMPLTIYDVAIKSSLGI